MAWQTPKVDWAAADGVRDTDMNRIEGNILDLYNRRPIESSIHLYVATTGSDTTGDGSQESPYATITKALSMVPANLNTYSAIIFIAAGAYTESIDVDGITNGNVNFGNQSSGSIVINGNFYVGNCQSVIVSGFDNVTINGRLNVENTTSFYSSSSVTIVDTVHAEALSARCATTIFSGNLSVKSLSYGSGVLADTGSNIYVENLTVQPGTGIGVKADYGGQVRYGSITNNATTKFATTRGGRIYTGAQNSMLNY